MGIDDLKILILIKKGWVNFFPICILILKLFRYRRSRVGLNYFELTDLNLLGFSMIISEEIVQENHAYFKYYVYC